MQLFSSTYISFRYKFKYPQNVWFLYRKWSFFLSAYSWELKYDPLERHFLFFNIKKEVHINIHIHIQYAYMPEKAQHVLYVKTWWKRIYHSTCIYHSMNLGRKVASNSGSFIVNRRQVLQVLLQKIRINLRTYVFATCVGLPADQ